MHVVKINVVNIEPFQTSFKTFTNVRWIISDCPDSSYGVCIESKFCGNLNFVPDTFKGLRTTGYSSLNHLRLLRLHQGTQKLPRTETHESKHIQLQHKTDTLRERM